MQALLICCLDTDPRICLGDRERDVAELTRLQAALQGALSQRRALEQRAEDAESALQQQQQLAAQSASASALASGSHP